MSHSPGDNSSPHAHKIAGEIENRLANGQPTSEVLHAEIHKLRQLDSHHGNLDKKAYRRDLTHIDEALRKKHILPDLHIATHGAHAGEAVASKHHVHNKPEGVRQHNGAPAREPSDRSFDNLLSATVPPLDSQPPSDAPKPPALVPAPAPLPESRPDPRQLSTRSDRPQPSDQAGTGPESETTGHLDSLKAAVERAKAGGRPLTITQIGDSHIAFGDETPAIAAKLAADLGLRADQIRFTSVGDVGKTASYAKDHPGEFMKNVNKDTDLTIVSFGSNEATKQEGASYARDYATLAGQIRSRNPETAMAMIAPTDGNFWNSTRHLPGLESVATAQEGVAKSLPNAAYYQVASRMGSVASMRAQGLMRDDNLHLTTVGYQKLGGMIADDIADTVKKSGSAS